MKRDFPPDERPPFFAVKRNIHKKIYDATFLLDEENGDIMGYSIVVAPSENRYILLTFFAILPEFRDRGIGGNFLKTICARYPGRRTVLEVEDPEAIADETGKKTAQRRIRFYERAGFFIHHTRRAKIFGVDMLIMANTDAPVSSVREIMHSLYLPSFSSKKWLKHIDVLD